MKTFKVQGRLGDSTILVGESFQNVERHMPAAPRVIITDETVLGITGPNAAPLDQQFLDEEFSVGNSVAGFTLDDTSEPEVTAHSIYTNWNFDND